MSSSVIPATTPVSWTAVPNGSAATPSFAFQNSSSTGIYRVAADSLGISTAGVQRVVVDASGNVGIGTASPTLVNYGRELSVSSTTGAQPEAFLCIQGAKTSDGNVGALTFFNSASSLGSIAGVRTGANNSGAIAFATASAGTVTERMRIDASGRLMVGATSSDYIFRANGFSHFGDAYDAGQYGAIQISRPQATSNKFHLACISSGLQVCGLGFLNNSNVFAVNNASTSNSNGVTLANGGTSWSPLSSDIRKKKNFETTQGLAEVLQIEPVKYHLLDDEDTQSKRLGFKAQNLQPLIPEMVIPNGQKAEDGSDYLTITPDYLLPVLVKAIQEQQAQIETLKAEVAALKAP